MSVFAGLEPAVVWKHFEALLAIPHPSGHEEALAQHVVGIAEQHGLATARDGVGNVKITVPASPGKEGNPTVVLQAHLDMVGVAAPGVEHDFTTDPIRPKVEGDYVRAQGTTLGADNGIGVAFMMALLEDECAHPELELLFTINEEAGMDGAHGLEGSFLKGRRLINLDTEEFGEIYISCAGGGDSGVRLPIERGTADTNATTLRVHVGGLLGGHSGVDISLGRGSGNKVLARLLRAGADKATVRIRSIAGGNKRNSISDWGEAVVDVPAGEVDAFKAAVDEMGALIAKELETTDSGMKITVEAGEAKVQPITAADSATLIDLLIALPHGVLAMSPDIEGLVETSTNVGTMKSGDDTFETVCLTRSSVTSFLEHTKRRIKTIAGRFGATVDEPRGYPGWKPNPDSEMLKVGKQVFNRLHGHDPEIKAIHAGLECGLFSEKLDGVDMISIGPDMADVHSPAEELKISSIKPFYELLKAILGEL